MGSRPDLKVDDEVGFIKFFRNLSANDNETVRIFDRGDWYTAHGDDATFIARTVGDAGASPERSRVDTRCGRSTKLHLFFVSSGATLDCPRLQ